MTQVTNTPHLNRIHQLYRQYEELVVSKFSEVIALLFLEKDTPKFEKINEVMIFIHRSEEDQQLLELTYKKIKDTVAVSIAEQLAELLQTDTFVVELKKALHDPEFALGFTGFLVEAGFFVEGAVDEVIEIGDMQPPLTTQQSAVTKLTEVDTTYFLPFDTNDNDSEQRDVRSILDVRMLLQSIFHQGSGPQILSQLTTLPRGKTHVTVPEKQLIREDLLSAILLTFALTQVFSEEYYLQHPLKKLDLTEKKTTYPNFITRLSKWKESEPWLSFAYEHKDLLQEALEQLVSRASTLLLKYTYSLDMSQEKVKFHLKNKLKFYVQLLLGNKPFQQGDLFNFYDSLVVAELLDAYLKRNDISYVKIVLPKRIEDFGASVDIYVVDTRDGRIFPIDITGVNRIRGEFEEKKMKSNNISFHEKTLIQFVDKKTLPYTSIQKVSVISTIQNNTHDWLYRYMQCHIDVFLRGVAGSDPFDLGSEAYMCLSVDDQPLADAFCREILRVMD